MSKRKNRKQKKEYDVGYCKPPEEYKWKKGCKSPNPSGRPKKFKNLQELIKEFKGKKYEVLAVEDGYLFQNKIYKSLSAIANEITGSHWNGKKFFGIT